MLIMAILRNNEIRDMGAEELDDHLLQYRDSLRKIKGVLASGGLPEDVGRTREIKRSIARILTEKSKRGENQQR